MLSKNSEHPQSQFFNKFLNFDVFFGIRPGLLVIETKCMHKFVLIRVKIFRNLPLTRIITVTLICYRFLNNNIRTYRTEFQSDKNIKKSNFQKSKNFYN